ncbi:MAG: TrbG/VirB9 family P-type conjugative transfer protein [Acidobacteriota bacterium]
MKRSAMFMVVALVAGAWMTPGVLAQEPEDLGALTQELQEFERQMRERSEALNLEASEIREAYETGRELPAPPEESLGEVRLLDVGAEADLRDSGEFEIPVVRVRPEGLSETERVGRAPKDEADGGKLQARPVVRFVWYGSEAAEVECAAYRVCTVVLEEGERIRARGLGDSQRWTYEEIHFGAERRPTPAIMVSPRGFGLRTNLVIFTNRRAYSVALTAVGEVDSDEVVEFTEMLSFRYPAPVATATMAPPPAPVEGAESGGEARGPSVAELNFGYEEDGPARRKLRWSPTSVFDDGERTYVVIPPEARSGGIPIVRGLVAGEPLNVNARLEGDRFVVPFVGEGLEITQGRRSLRLVREALQ